MKKKGRKNGSRLEQSSDCNADLTPMKKSKEGREKGRKRGRRGGREKGREEGRREGRTGEKEGREERKTIHQKDRFVENHHLPKNSLYKRYSLKLIE